jgi:hypothetical protein
MFIRPAKVLVVIMLATTLGMHWALLQTLAWTTMLADNLNSVPFQEAVTKTFDGKHPCPLCKAVAAGKNSEHKKEFSFDSFKPEFPLFAEVIVPVAPSEYQLCPRENFSAPFLTQQPPTPPPRGCLA